MKKRVKKNIDRRREESFFRKNYSLSWNYIKESKSYIIAISLIFVFGILISLVYQPTAIVDLIRSFFGKVINETEGLGLLELIIYILNNNLKSSFFAMILGIAFGIFPILSALMNSYVLGFVSEKSVLAGGPSVLLRLVPHGIFEFPAIIISMAFGVKLGFSWFGKDKRKTFLSRFEDSLRTFLFIILPLLIIAAIIEGALIFVLA